MSGVPRDRSVCRYCGAPAHVPADSCLTLSYKLLRIFGWVMAYTLGIGVLIGLVVWLGTSGAFKPAPSAPVPPASRQVCVQSGPYGERVCHSERP